MTGAHRHLVLVTVGTDHHAFRRLLEWVDSWARQHPTVDVLVQSGATPCPSGLDGQPFFPVEELRELMRRASVVVSHGGPGTVAEAHHAGHVPVVVPRDPTHGEHVDDHQLRFTARLAEDGQVHRAVRRAQLIDVLDQLFVDAASFRQDARVADVGASVEAFAHLVAARPPRAARRQGARGAVPTTDGSSILFIAGWGRSGSTLLARLLGSVEGVTTVGELRDIVQHGVVENRRCGCGAPFHDCPQWRRIGDEAFGGWAAVDREDMLRLRRQLDRPWWLPALATGHVPDRRRQDLDALVAFLRRLYSAIRDVTGAKVVVDSSKLATYGLLLDRAMPGRVRVVHLVRDPRGVVSSWSKHVALPDLPGRQLRMIRYGTVAASLRYDLYNLAVAAAPPLRRTAVRLRYEDLVTDPAGHVAHLLAHAGMTPTTAMLTHLGDPTAIRLGTDHTVDGNPMRFSTGALELRDDQSWRDDLSPRRRHTVDLVTAPWLAAYGYAANRRLPVVAGQSAAPSHTRRI